jgi:hypothetical protein
MSGLVKRNGVAFIAADAIEHGVRNVLTGEPHQMLRHVEFTGSAEWKTSFTQGGDRKPFSNKGKESELTLQAIMGMLDYYRRNNESVAFEGASFTPKWVNDLKLDDYLTIRAAFVGFTNPGHADQVLAFAKANPHDWVNVWLEKDNGDETKIREWIVQQSEKCVELKAEAERLGYKFFDISSMPFEEYIASVQRYFLQD